MSIFNNTKHSRPESTFFLVEGGAHFLTESGAKYKRNLLLVTSFVFISMSTPIGTDKINSFLGINLKNGIVFEDFRLHLVLVLAYFWIYYFFIIFPECRKERINRAGKLIVEGQGLTVPPSEMNEIRFNQIAEHVQKTTEQQLKTIRILDKFVTINHKDTLHIGDYNIIDCINDSREDVNELKGNIAGITQGYEDTLKKNEEFLLRIEKLYKSVSLSMWRVWLPDVIFPFVYSTSALILLTANVFGFFELENARKFVTEMLMLVSDTSQSHLK